MKTLPVRLTSFGKLFLLILLPMFIGAINYNNSLAYLLVFVCFSLYALTFYEGWKNIKDLTIISYPVNSQFMGESIGIKTQFSSVSRWKKDKFNCLYCEYDLMNDSTQKKIKGISSFLSLLRDQKMEQKIEFKPIGRGCFQLTEFICSSQYPLALFKWTYRIPYEKKSFFIYPEPINYSTNERSYYSSMQNKTGSDQFKELSRYQTGETLSKICWKTYARSEQLMTKIFEQEQQSKQIIYQYNDLSLMKKEHKLSQLCYWIKQAHQIGLYYGLNIPGQMIKPNHGTAHYHRCLVALAQA